MNDYDQKNLRFLLSRSPEQLRDWYNSVGDDDLLYAWQLMERYGQFLELEMQCQAIEQQLEAMPVLTEAQAVIAMVRG